MLFIPNSEIIISVSSKSVADPGFHRREVPIPQFDAKTYNLTRFLPQLHKSKKLDQDGVWVPSAPPPPILKRAKYP